MIGPVAEYQVNLIREDRVAEHIDRKVLGQRLQTLQEPLAPMGVVGPGVRIEATDKASPYDPVGASANRPQFSDNVAKTKVTTTVWENVARRDGINDNALPTSASRPATHLNVVSHRILALLCLLVTGPMTGDSRVLAESSSERLTFLESKIRPVLVKHCCQCPNNDADEISVKLQVDSRQRFHEMDRQWWRRSTHGSSAPAKDCWGWIVKSFRFITADEPIA